jgi:hypothetical protein
VVKAYLQRAKTFSQNFTRIEKKIKAKNQQGKAELFLCKTKEFYLSKKFEFNSFRNQSLTSGFRMLWAVFQKKN